LSIYGRGDPDYTAELTKFSQQRQLQVTFTQADLEQMPNIYRDHDLLLFTSEWAEPFALTPLEAMACGLPVIGTLTGGSAELFRARENALVFAAGNAEELRDRILEFAADYELRRRCARTAYCEAIRRYAAPVIVDQIEGYLRDTVRTWCNQH
jgi:glycosyltransferase involved in cell wall biosynthesis